VFYGIWRKGKLQENNESRNDSSSDREIVVGVGKLEKENGMNSMIK